MKNLIIVAIVLIVVILAVIYIRREKKKGKNCVGCPDSASCPFSGNGGCCSNLNK